MPLAVAGMYALANEGVDAVEPDPWDSLSAADVCQDGSGRRCCSCSPRAGASRAGSRRHPEAIALMRASALDTRELTRLIREARATLRAS